jgi:hypothetical protein
MGAGLLAALAGLATPILARVLLALGFSVVTLGGVAASVAALREAVLDGLGAWPMAALQLAGLLGVFEGLGMVLGAVSWAVTYWGLTRAVRLVGVPA